MTIASGTSLCNCASVVWCSSHARTQQLIYLCHFLCEYDIAILKRSGVDAHNQTHETGPWQYVGRLSRRLFELLFGDLRGPALDLPGADAVLVDGAGQQTRARVQVGLQTRTASRPGLQHPQGEVRSQASTDIYKL